MHTSLDLHGNIPTFINITDGKVHEVSLLAKILPEAGAFYVRERGYVDFARFYSFIASGAFFVVRTKSNVIWQRRYSHAVDKTTGVRSDHTVILTAVHSALGYPDTLRRATDLDVDTKNESSSSPTTSYFQHLLSRRSKGPLTGETLLSMDQAAPLNQSLLGHQRERGEDPNRDGGIGLRAGRHRP